MLPILSKSIFNYSNNSVCVKRFLCDFEKFSKLILSPLLFFAVLINFSKHSKYQRFQKKVTFIGVKIWENGREIVKKSA